MPTFFRDGINFHYVENGSGTPFFFLHGLGSDSRQTLMLFRPPPGFRIISFDSRAHGLTAPVGPSANIRLSVFADDLIAFMDHLAVEKAVIGGISMGAAVSLNATLRYPERVRGLVLSRPAWLDCPNPWNVMMFSLVARLLREHGPKKGKEVFEQSPEYRETFQQYPDVARSLAAQFDNPRALDNAVNLELIPKDRPNSDRREWKQIKVPTLVLANGHDPVHPLEYGMIVAKEIPQAEFYEITAKSIDLDRHVRDVQHYLGNFLVQHFGSGDGNR